MAQRLLVLHGVFPLSGQAAGYLALPPGERIMVDALILDYIRRRKEAE